MSVCMYCNPPTPAFAEARAAPGTTGDVELGSFVACHGNNGIPTQQAKATGNNSRSHMPQPSVFKDVRACRLPALKGNWQQLSQPRPSHLFLRAFEPAVCPPSNATNPPAGLSKATGNNDSRSHAPAICF